MAETDTIIVDLENKKMLIETENINLQNRVKALDDVAKDIMNNPTEGETIEAMKKVITGKENAIAGLENQKKLADTEFENLQIKLKATEESADKTVDDSDVKKDLVKCREFLKRTQEECCLEKELKVSG